MSEFQTTVQDLTAILRGSGMLELSAVAASPSWLDVGAIQGLKATEELEVNAEENDNTDSTDRVTKQTLTVACTLMEAISDAVRTLIRGDLDTRTPTAGGAVTGEEFTLHSGSWDVQTFYELPGQNATEAKQTIASVVASVNSTLTAGEDYEQAKVGGKWGILFMTLAESTALDTLVQDIVVTYGYTPIASVKWQTGDKSELTMFMARITTLNDDNTFIITAYYGNIKKGYSLDYQKDDANDRRVGLPVEFIFKTLPDGLGDEDNQGKVWDSVQVSGF